MKVWVPTLRTHAPVDHNINDQEHNALRPGVEATDNGKSGVPGGDFRHLSEP